MTLQVQKPTSLVNIVLIAILRAGGVNNTKKKHSKQIPNCLALLGYLRRKHTILTNTSVLIQIDKCSIEKTTVETAEVKWTVHLTCQYLHWIQRQPPWPAVIVFEEN